MRSVPAGNRALSRPADCESLILTFSQCEKGSSRAHSGVFRLLPLIWEICGRIFSGLLQLFVIDGDGAEGVRRFFRGEVKELEQGRANHPLIADQGLDNVGIRIAGARH